MNSPVPPSPSPLPRPLQLVDGNLQSPADSSCPPTPLSGLSTPPPSARKVNPRRQSSISYYPSDHTPSWDLRSPTTAGPGPSSLRRSTSLNQKIPARLDLKGHRRSLPPSEVEAVEGPLTDRPPLTLTEKYVLPTNFCVYPIALALADASTHLFAMLGMPTSFVSSRRKSPSASSSAPSSPHMRQNSPSSSANGSAS